MVSAQPSVHLGCIDLSSPKDFSTVIKFRAAPRAIALFSLLVTIAVPFWGGVSHIVWRPRVVFSIGVDVCFQLIVDWDCNFDIASLARLVVDQIWYYLRAFLWCFRLNKPLVRAS